MSLFAKSSSVTLRALAIFIIVLKLGWQVFVTHLETVVWSRCNSSASHLFVSCFSASMTFILLSCLLIIRLLFKVWMQSYKITYRCNINRPKISAENINFIANPANLCVHLHRVYYWRVVDFRYRTEVSEDNREEVTDKT